jgi:hypothetical protein
VLNIHAYALASYLRIHKLLATKQSCYCRCKILPPGQAALQQLRATTERRRSKLEARWTARLSSEAEAHSAAVERQRVLARQLQEDCDALRDKGDAFESQAAKARAGRAADCDAGVH